jgi:Holliday junction DNA helicase RuvB
MKSDYFFKIEENGDTEVAPTKAVLIFTKNVSWKRLKISMIVSQAISKEEQKAVPEENLIQKWQASDLDKETNFSLRPSKLDQYIGQSSVVRQLKLILDSAKIRQVLPENILFYGQPGLGKTTLASIISEELGCNFKIISAPSLQRVGDLVSLLLNLEAKTVLFIDEIHRLKAPLEEILYTAMEDKQIDLVMGKGHGAKATRIDLMELSIIGATTQLGKISKPLKDRFTAIFHLEPYSEVEITQLIERNSQLLDLKLENGAKTLVAKYSRGIPRITNHLLKRLLDYQTVYNLDKITAKQVENFFTDLGIYDLGLTKTDLKYLHSLDETASLGLKTLASILMEEAETLELVVEPYLLHLGLIHKSSKGRNLTFKGKKLLESDSRFKGVL